MPFSFAAVQGLLRCPKSRSELVEDEDALVCVDPHCRLRFAVRDQIPIMLVDEAVEMAPHEWEAVMRRSGRES